VSALSYRSCHSFFPLLVTVFFLYPPFGRILFAFFKHSAAHRARRFISEHSFFSWFLALVRPALRGCRSSLPVCFPWSPITVPWREKFFSSIKDFLFFVLGCPQWRTKFPLHPSSSSGLFHAGAFLTLLWRPSCPPPCAL